MFELKSKFNQINFKANGIEFFFVCILALKQLRRYFCRSVEFDDQTKQCILSEEDSISQKDDISVSSSPTHHFYDLVCLDNRKYLFNNGISIC